MAEASPMCRRRRPAVGKASLQTVKHIDFARIGWLRAGVMGANDGVVSTSSLLLGIAASGARSLPCSSPVPQAWWPVPCPWRREAVVLEFVQSTLPDVSALGQKPSFASRNA